MATFGSAMKFSEAFQEISVYFERSGSGTVLFSGIPDDQVDDPDIETVREVSNRIGLDVAEVRISELFGGNANFPVLARTLTGKFLPVFSRNDDGTYLCKETAGESGLISLDLRGREDGLDRTVLDFKKHYFQQQGRDRRAACGQDRARALAGRRGSTLLALICPRWLCRPLHQHSCARLAAVCHECL